jgi:PAS domain S-box-containing protein
MRPADDPDLVFLLEQVLDAAIDLQGADFGDVQLYDGENGTLRIVAHRGVGQEFLEHFACVDADDTCACGTALKLGKRVIIEDVAEYAPFAPHLGVASRTGYRGVNCTPLTERGTGLPLGMLSTLFREPYQSDERRLQLSDVLAAHAADLVSCHRAQQKLRESEEFLRLALEGGRMGTWEWDSETHLIKADAAHQAFFGMLPQERPMPNEAYWKLMDREEGEIGTKRAQDALEQGTDIEVELRVYPPDGKLRWISVRGRPRNGGSESIIGISYDITERKEQEEALREYQEWLPALLDQLPGGVGLFDKKGVSVIRGGPLARLWADVLPSEDPASRARWRSFDASGRPLPFNQYPGARALRGEIVSPGTDFLYADPDRREHWYRVSSAPFRDETGAITGATVFIQDVDKEKRADEHLRQSEERLNAAVELAGLGLYSVQIDGGADLLTWDNRVRSLWGLPPDCDVTHDMWESAIHADDRERVRAAVARAYDPSGDGVYDAEYRVVGADGVERWVATRAQARFEHGQPVSLLGVVRDITDRKMIEHGLELVVDVRTSELIDASATLQAEREARQRTAERLELLQGELSRGLFAAIESRRVGLARPAELRVREAAHKITQLSRRERQVLDGLVQGEPHKTIAHRLGISVRTVEIHRTRMLHRLGTPHLAEAIRLAVLAELAGE